MREPVRARSPIEETEAVISQLDRSLRRLRISRADRQAITDDVRGDLQAGAAEGVRAAELIGPDVDAFAREAVEAGGYAPVAGDYQRLVVNGTLAAALGLPASYVLLSYVVHPLFVHWFDLDGDYPVAGPVLAYTFMVLASTVVILAALYVSLGGRPARNETVARAALLTPVGGALGIVAVLSVMSRPSFTLSEASVFTQVVPAGAIPVLIALVASRWWARRAAAPHLDHGSASEPSGFASS